MSRYGVERLLLKDAFRLGTDEQVAIVGAGGKTSALFQLARETSTPVIVSTTTHLGVGQANLADRAIIVNNPDDTDRVLANLSDETSVTLITGPAHENERFASPDSQSLGRISQYCRDQRIPFLIEADGSKFLPLKAPGAHEPPIPTWVDKVIVVIGMSAIGKKADDTTIHRPEVYYRLAGIEPSATIEEKDIVKVLVHKDGGLKNMPGNAVKCALLNQADDRELREMAMRISFKIIGSYDIVATSRLLDDEKNPITSPVIFRDEPIAGIILAAGGATRYGSQKLLLDWQGIPLIRHVVEVVCSAGVQQVVVVTGEDARSVGNALFDLPVKIIQNKDWRQGQSTSLRVGLQALDGYTGGAVFFLGDQPGISELLIHHLVDIKRTRDFKIIAPAISGRRTTPTLFDRSLYERLAQLSGDEGGRQLFAEVAPHLVPWEDPRLSFDIDTPDDYRFLKSRYE